MNYLEEKCHSERIGGRWVSGAENDRGSLCLNPSAL